MEKPSKIKQITLVVFTLTVVLALVLPNLVQHGMFMDGTQYATVSMNYAQGKGTFWFPFLSSSWEKQGQNPFLEHPPLIYFLQSFFFKLFGDGFLSERIYCFITMLLSAGLIALIWQQIFNKEKMYRKHWWLPILFWIIIPSVYWSYINNMHENTVSVFVLASVYLVLRSRSAKRTYSWLYVTIAAFCIFLGSFSKGLPALFPLAIFFCLQSSFKNITWKSTIGNTLVLTGIPIIIYAILIYTSKDAASSLNFYFKERLLHRVKYDHEVSNRLSVLFWLLTDLLVPIGVLMIFILISRWRKIKLNSALKNEHQPILYFFVLVGLCGVVPLSFTHVQRAVYFVPALPFLSIALALLFIKDIASQIEKIKITSVTYKAFMVLTFVAAFAVMFYSVLVFGKAGRDQEVLKDVELIASTVGKHSKVHASYDIYLEWGFQFYLLRYHHIELDHKLRDQRYAIVLKQEPTTQGYKETDVSLGKYKLLKKINAQ